MGANRRGRERANIRCKKCCNAALCGLPSDWKRAASGPGVVQKRGSELMKRKMGKVTLWSAKEKKRIK